VELLGDVFAQDPEVHAYNGGGDELVYCFWCLAGVGQHHEETCLWVRVAQVLEQGDLAAARRVGESTDDALDRLEEDDGVEDVARQVLERVNREALTPEGLHPDTLDLVREVAIAQESCDDLLDELPTPVLIRDVH
jgi:hypothetical protein